MTDPNVRYVVQEDWFRVSIDGRNRLQVELRTQCTDPKHVRSEDGVCWWRHLDSIGSFAFLAVTLEDGSFNVVAGNAIASLRGIETHPKLRVCDECRALRGVCP